QRVEEFLRYAIGVGVKEAHPQQIFDAGEAGQQLCEAIAQTEVFAVGSGVLTNQGDFASACGCEILRFAYYRFEAAATKFAAQLRNDAESAGMIATLGNFYVRGVARRGNNTGRK